MNPKHLLLALLVPVLSLTSCSTTVISKNYLNVQGAKLRKTIAFRTQILQGGNKINEGINSFSSYDLVSTSGAFPVTVTTSLTVGEVSSWLTKLGLDGVPQVSAAEGSVSGSRTDKGTFVVVAIQNRKDLLDLLRKPQNQALVQWLSTQRKPRLITAVAMTQGQKSIRKTEVNGTVTANLSTVGVGAGSAKAEVKITKDSTTEFSDGTVFAYEMSIPLWSRDAQGALYIADYVTDRPGLRNPKPAPGTSLDPTEVP